MTLFKKRYCPSCSEEKANNIVSMTVRTLLQSNPGYDNEWFVKSDFPLDYELNIVRCNACNFVYVDEILNDDVLFEYYNQGIDAEKSKAKIYKSEKRNFLIEVWRKLHLNHINTVSNIKVLDFGAGWGDFLAVARCIGVETFGLEYDQRKIEFALSQGITLGNLDIIEKNAPYDIFMCNQVLEHLNDPKAAIQTLRNVVKKGAIGFNSVPNYSDQTISKEVISLKNGTLPSKNFDLLGHLNYFNPINLRDMVFKAGFREILKPNPIKEKNNIKRMLKNILLKQAKLSLPTTSIYVEAI